MVVCFFPEGLSLTLPLMHSSISSIHKGNDDPEGNHQALHTEVVPLGSQTMIRGKRLDRKSELVL